MTLGREAAAPARDRGGRRDNEPARRIVASDSATPATPPWWADAAARNDILIARTLDEIPYWYEGVLDRVRRSPDGCELWLGKQDRRGYGIVRLPSHVADGCDLEVLVHRVRYLAEVGPIAYGQVVDHLVCSRPACSAPSHLQATSMRQNLMRPGSRAPAALNAAKTHCVRGHELAGANLATDGRGHRRCTACLAENAEARRAARRITGLTGGAYLQKFGAALEVCRLIAAHEHELLMRSEDPAAAALELCRREGVTLSPTTPHAAVVSEACQVVGLTREQYVARFAYRRKVAETIVDHADAIWTADDPTGAAVAVCEKLGIPLPREDTRGSATRLRAEARLVLGDLTRAEYRATFTESRRTASAIVENAAAIAAAPDPVAAAVEVCTAAGVPLKAGKRPSEPRTAAPDTEAGEAA